MMIPSTWGLTLALLMAVPTPSRAASPEWAVRVQDLRSGPVAMRQHAAAVLGRLGDAAAGPALIQALADDSAAVRHEAALALGHLKVQAALPALVKALEDTNIQVRVHAAYALGEIKSAPASPALIKALRDPSWHVRDQAAWALRELHDVSVVAPLVELLRENQPDLEHITWLLRQVAGSKACPPVAGLLKSSSPTLRERAVRVLGELKTPEAIPALTSALQDQDAQVRLAAVETLGQSTDEGIRKALETLAAHETDARVRDLVASLVRRPAPGNTLGAWWNFDDKDLHIARDVTSGGTHGEIKGCTVVPGKVGFALQFDKSSVISLGKPAKLPTANVPHTVMAWVKTGVSNGVVVARGGAFCGYSLQIKDGVPRFGIRRLQGGDMSVAAATQKIPETWTHLAGVIKENGVELYVNGQLATATKSEGYLPSNCGQGMEIGFDIGNSAVEITDHFIGIIDEVKVFLAALPEEEIRQQAGLR